MKTAPAKPRRVKSRIGDNRAGELALIQEKLAAAHATGRITIWPLDSYTEETPEMRKAYPVMLRSPIVKSALLQKIFAVCSLDLQVSPATSEPRDKEIADFVHYAFTTAFGGSDINADKLPVAPTNGELVKIGESILLPGLTTGKSICNKVFFSEPWQRGRFKGKRFLRDVKAKEFADFEQDDFKNITGVFSTRSSDEDYNAIYSPEDFVCFRFLPLYEGSGMSDLRSVYGYWQRLDTLLNIWIVHLEKFLSPHLLVQYKPGRTATQITALEADVRKAKSLHYTMVPDDVVIEALQFAQRGEAEMEKACRYYEEKIALGVAGAYLQMMTAGGKGEMRGDSETQKSTSELFIWHLAALLTSIMNKQLTPSLVRENYIDADFPILSLGGVNWAELLKSLEIEKKAQEMGANLSRRAFMTKYSLQEAENAADVLTPVPMFGSLGGFPGTSPGGGFPPPGGSSEALALSGDIQSTALNGAQITSLLAVTDKVVSGELTPAAAVAILQQAFPTMEPAKIADLIRKVQMGRAPASPDAAGFFAERPGEAATVADIVEDRAEVSAAGADTAAAVQLLSAANGEGVQTMAEIAESALTRWLGKGPEALLRAKHFFDDDETDRLAQQLVKVNGTAELLGRARIRLRQQEAIANRGNRKFSEHRTAGFLRIFAEPVRPLTPADALEYFRGLVPQLGTDPERFGRRLERHAFTMAEASDHRTLGVVQDIITRRMETGLAVRAAKDDIDDILAAAGVHPRNPQYSEMVLRTNMMDNYNTGRERELANEDVQETFPVWMYGNPRDTRSRDHHADKDGLYFSSKVPFTAVRGTDAGDVCNCRCIPIEIDKWEWQALQQSGKRITRWAA